MFFLDVSRKDTLSRMDLHYPVASRDARLAMAAAKLELQEET